MKRTVEATGSAARVSPRASCTRSFAGLRRAAMGARSFAVLRRVAIALAGAAFPVLAASVAGSGEPVRVIVVATGAGDPVAARLIDELIASGVTVEVTADEADPSSALARSRGARAVVRVEASRRAVRVWLSDASGAPDTLAADPGGDADTAARALALRVVEVLRPHLIPADTSADADAGPASSSSASAIPWPPVPLPPPTAEPTASSSAGADAGSAGVPSSARPGGTAAPSIAPRASDAWPDSLAIYIAPTLLLHPATALAPSGGALWGVTKMVFPWAGIDVCALVPVVPGVLSTPAGQVKIATGAIGAGVMFRYPSEPAAFTGWLGAGLAAGFVGYDAEASNGAVRASDGIVAHALPYARGAVEWRAWPSLGVRLDVLAGIARPRPVLEIAGHPDTPLEEPLLAFSLGVLTWLP